MPLDRAFGDTQSFRHFLVRQAAEKFEHDNVFGFRILAFQSLERLIDQENLLIRCRGRQLELLRAQARLSAASLQP